MGNRGTVLRTAEHRGIGPGCWPTEVDARAGGCATALCTILATAAVLWRWLTGCLAARADTLTERERKSVGGGDIRAY